MIPSFAPVSGGEMDIQDIKLDSSTASSWEDEIQILDNGGATIETYVYATADESGLDADGWIDSESQLAKRVITKGMSVLINTAAETSVTFAGSVATEDTTIEAVAGFNFIGNNTPVAIDIQDVQLNEDATSWEDEIQILDNGGATVETYVYATADESGLDSNGWINAESELAVRELDAGLGILVNIANPGTVITIPAAL